MVAKIHPKRKLIATTDLVGVTYNGGIGTAFTALAEYWASQDDDVTVIWPFGPNTEMNTPWHDVVNEYADKNISLVAIPQPKHKFATNLHDQINHFVYEWIKEFQDNFDYVIGHEWHGVLAATAQGRATGAIRIPVVVNTHSPTYWHISYDQLFVDDGDLMVDAMERNSVRFSDVVVSPTKYMVDWMKHNSWPIDDKRTMLIPNQFPNLDWPDSLPSTSQVDELCFVGRLDGRKGIDLFCDVIDNLLEERDDFMVTLLGKEGYVRGAPAREYLMERTSKWEIPLNMIGHFGQKEAIEYLQQSGRMAVICSAYENAPYVVMEAALAGYPFLVRGGGGVHEMIDHKHMFLTERDLEEKINDILDNGYTIPEATLNYSKAAVDAGWEELDERIADIRVQTQERKTQKPKVSVVVTHYNRPKMLKRCIKALIEQTYSNYEIIVVDDCSKPELMEEVNRICNRPKVKLIEKPVNQYLGAARNTGISQAKGKYIIFCDDDNVPYSDMIEKFVEAIETSGADFVTTPLAVFTGKSYFSIDHIYPFVGTEPHIGFYSNQIGDATMIIKQDSISGNNWFTTYRTGHEDWEFLVKCLLKGLLHVAYPEPLIHYQRDAQGMLISGNKAADIRRNLTGWANMDPQSYYGKLIHEVAIATNAEKKSYMRRNMQLQNQLQAQQEPERPLHMQPASHLPKATKKKTSRGRRGKK